MKHKIRKTGELISVISYNGDIRRDWMDKVSYIDSKGKEHVDEQLNYYWDLEEIEDFKNGNIDWEQRRYEVAKTALAGINAHDGVMKIVDDVNLAIRYADEMIKQLKTKEYES